MKKRQKIETPTFFDFILSDPPFWDTCPFMSDPFNPSAGPKIRMYTVYNCISVCNVSSLTAVYNEFLQKRWRRKLAEFFNTKYLSHFYSDKGLIGTVVNQTYWCRVTRILCMTVTLKTQQNNQSIYLINKIYRHKL